MLTKELLGCSKELGGSPQKDYIANNIANTVLERLNSVFLITSLSFMKPCITATLQPFASHVIYFNSLCNYFQTPQATTLTIWLLVQVIPLLFISLVLLLVRTKISSEAKVSHFRTDTYSVLLNQHTEYCSWT